MAAGLTQPEQREQQFLFFSRGQTPFSCQALGSLGQQLSRDGAAGPQAALSVLSAVEVSLDGAELETGSVLVLWGETKLMGYVCLCSAP